MSKSIVIIGFGPGVAAAIADKFGAEGFSISLVARNKERLDAAVAALRAKGVAAAAFPADASDPVAVRAAIKGARAAFGPIGVLQWNAVAGTEIADILAAQPEAVMRIFDSAVAGLLSAVQETLPDLRNAENPAILVTNGMSGETSDFVDAFGVHRNVMGLSLANATKSKLVGLLAQKLKADGIYVGQVTIAGLIKGSRPGMEGGIETATVADKFWELYRAREEIRARVS